MTTLRMSWRCGAALLWVALVTSSPAVPLPQQAREPAVQPASDVAGGQEDSFLQLQKTASVAIDAPFANPFAAVAPRAGNEQQGPFNGQAAAAPAAYPAGAPAPPPSSSSWAPTHFEIYGDVQSRNLTNSGGFSSTYCLPSGCVTNTSSLGNAGLGLEKWGVGPDFGFIWTPDKKILGAKSKIWTAFEQLDRSTTHNISREFTFNGVTYAINTTLETQLNTNLFSLGWAPQWGNDKFRIGPEVVYQHLLVDFILTNLTPGAAPPSKKN